MGKSSLSVVFAVSLISTVSLTVGCSKPVATPPPAAASKTTDQIMRENPELKKSVTAKLEAQIQQSNLPAEEKQRQIARLRAEGPPR